MRSITRKAGNSVSVFENGQSLTVQLCLVLLPFISVQLLQSFVPQDFQFFVGLLQLLVYGPVVSCVSLAHRVLLVGLVPRGNPLDSCDFSYVAAVMSLVIFLGPALHDGVVRLVPF